MVPLYIRPKMVVLTSCWVVSWDYRLGLLAGTTLVAPFGSRTRLPCVGPASSEQNGIAERMNRTIQERAASMLQHSGLLNGFLTEALRTTVHIINM